MIRENTLQAVCHFMYDIFFSLDTFAFNYKIQQRSQANNFLILKRQFYSKTMNHSVSTLTGKTKIKIVFLGNQAVGKSSVIQQYIHNRFQQTSHPTVGIDFLAKNVAYKTKNFRLQLWDTAGQQRFRSLIPSYLKDSQCALILFDVTSKDSFNAAEDWIRMYNQNKTGGTTLLVGNKIDLPRDRQVSVEQGIKKAQQLGICYFEISAKTGQNVQSLFMNLVQICSQASVDLAKYSFQKLNQPTKIDEVEEKNQDDKEKESKTIEQPNFSKSKTKNNTQTQQNTTQKSSTQKIDKIQSNVEKSQQNQSKVIRLQEKKSKSKKKKNCC